LTQFGLPRWDRKNKNTGTLVKYLADELPMETTSYKQIILDTHGADLHPR